MSMPSDKPFFIVASTSPPVAMMPFKVVIGFSATSIPAFFAMLVPIEARVSERAASFPAVLAASVMPASIGRKKPEAKPSHQAALLAKEPSSAP